MFWSSVTCAHCWPPCSSLCYKPTPSNSPVCGSGLTAFEGPANQRLFDCSMTTQSGPRQRPLTAAAQAV